MIMISNYDIYISKGNNILINVDIYNGNDKYTPQDGEKLVFSLKKGVNDKSYIIQKDIIDGRLELSVYDTDLNVGKYKYDIALIGDNKKDTIIGPCDLYIEEVVNNDEPGG